MERTETTLKWETEAMKNCLAFFPEPAENICFFDIETTGLSPKVSSLYLIGAAVWDTDHFDLVQWFADDYTSEKDILLSFSDFVSTCTTVVHYNGSSFDIPYLEKKYMAHQLPSPFPSKKSVDLMRGLPKDKAFFKTDNRRLTSMEKLLSFTRNDTFTGKDCIRLYTDFMQKKYFRDRTAEDTKQQLLLHNHDDLQGTILCAQLLAYQNGIITFSSMEVQTETETPFIRLNAELSTGQFPLDLEWKTESKTGIHLHFCYQKNRIILEISLYKGELYYFFKDYKNYFYLPKEDMAVHKSVGTYVDKEYRRQATASTCYVKKSGFFLPIPASKKAEEAMPSDMPLFRENFKSRTVYIETDRLSALSDTQMTSLFALFRQS